MPPFKPANYSTASPYLIVSDAAGTIKFLQDVFAATVLRTFPDSDGRLMHAEVRIDDSVLMLADSAPEWPAMRRKKGAFENPILGSHVLSSAAGLRVAAGSDSFGTPASTALQASFE